MPEFKIGYVLESRKIEIGGEFEIRLGLRVYDPVVFPGGYIFVPCEKKGMYPDTDGYIDVELVSDDGRQVEVRFGGEAVLRYEHKRSLPKGQVGLLAGAIFNRAKHRVSFKSIVPPIRIKTPLEKQMFYLTGDPGSEIGWSCLLYTSPSPRDKRQSRMPSSA